MKYHDFNKNYSNPITSIMKKILFFVMVIFMMTHFSSCTSVTEITGTWKKPATAAKKYTKIIVLGMTGDIVKRSTVENSVVQNLMKNGINAVAGSNILPDTFMDSDKNGKVDDKAKEIITTKLKEQGIDGAFTMSLDDVKESERYVPGSSYYVPYTNYFPFYNYYYTSYDRVNAPGYYTKSTNVFLTSNFYDVSSEQLVWSAQSNTINPQSLTDFAKSYGVTIVDDFLGDGVIKK